jgi:cytochrome c553
MLPHGAKRSFHFARKATLVTHCGRCHARAQNAVQLVQSSRISGERDGDLHILFY